MARIRKKKIKRVRKNRVQVKSKKVNYSLYIAFFVVLAFVIVVVYIVGSLGKSQPSGGVTNENQATNNPQTETRASIGGFCKRDSECFVTSCKGQTQDCINVTQMATYANDNCKTYLDWNEVKQNVTACGCIQNACTMK